MTMPILSLVAMLAASYIDAPSYFASDTGREVFTTEAYEAALEGLVTQFDEICGDSFCEGEFSNLTSLGIDCSINRATTAVGACVWTFAGSYSEVDPSTGRIKVVSAVRACDFGFVGDASALARYLEEAGRPDGFAAGLRTVAIPGHADAKSLYGVLADCL